MIPVPDSELELYDLEHEPDEKYKDLVQDEIIFIRKNQKKIVGYAKLLYKQKDNQDETAGYVKHALDFKSLEKHYQSVFQLIVFFIRLSLQVFRQHL